MYNTPEDQSLTGVERSLFVKATTLKSLLKEHMLYKSELRALAREYQSDHVINRRKDLNDRVIPEMEEEMQSLQDGISYILGGSSTQLIPSAEYYVLAEKVVAKMDKVELLVAAQ